MRFKISRDKLLAPLQIVSSVVERRATLPILSNILLRVGNDRLQLTGTDMEIEMSAWTDLPGLDSFDTTLPAKKFVDICRSLPDNAELELIFEDERATIRSGRSRFTLSTLPAINFPSTDSGDPLGGTADTSTTETEEWHSYTLPQTQLKQLIDKVAFSMAHQDVRYFLNGLLLELDGDTLSSVATDGHRLALCRLDSTQALGDKRQALIPRKGVSELNRLLSDAEEPCNLAISENHIRVELDGLRFISKLIDGRFPDYERAIPRSNDQYFLANRDALRQALQRTAVLVNDSHRGVRITLEENLLRMQIHNPDQDEAQEELEVEYNGEPIEIGFNITYLLDVVNAIRHEQLSVAIANSNSSALIQAVGDDSATYVVMPMRL